MSLHPASCDDTVLHREHSEQACEISHGARTERDPFQMEIYAAANRERGKPRPRLMAEAIPLATLHHPLLLGEGARKRERTERHVRRMPKLKGASTQIAPFLHVALSGVWGVDGPSESCIGSANSVNREPQQLFGNHREFLTLRFGIVKVI